MVVVLLLLLTLEGALGSALPRPPLDGTLPLLSRELPPAERRLPTAPPTLLLRSRRAMRSAAANAPSGEAYSLEALRRRSEARVDEPRPKSEARACAARESAEATTTPR